MEQTKHQPSKQQQSGFDSKKPKANTEHTKVGDSIRHAGESIDHFSEKVGDRTDRVIHKSEEIAEDVRRKSKEYGESVVKLMKENPIKSTVIAGAVGLLIGRLMKR